MRSVASIFLILFFFMSFDLTASSVDTNISSQKINIYKIKKDIKILKDNYEKIDYLALFATLVITMSSFVLPFLQDRRAKMLEEQIKNENNKIEKTISHEIENKTFTIFRNYADTMKQDALANLKFKIDEYKNEYAKKSFEEKQLITDIGFVFKSLMNKINDNSNLDSNQKLKELISLFGRFNEIQLAVYRTFYDDKNEISNGFIKLSEYDEIKPYIRKHLKNMIKDKNEKFLIDIYNKYYKA